MVVLAVVLHTVVASGVQNLDLMDASQLRHVLKGGYPWVIICSDGSAPIPPEFQEASTLLDGTARAGVVDCTRTMPSGKTIAQALDLRTSVSPVIFRVANGARPVQVMPGEFADVQESASGGKQAAVFDALQHPTQHSSRSASSRSIERAWPLASTGSLLRRRRPCSRLSLENTVA